MRRLLAALAVLALCSCASATSQLLTDDTALISARGVEPNDQTRVVNATVAEAARLTRARGYSYFVILSAADASVSEVRLLPSSPAARQSPSVNLFSEATRFATISRDGALRPMPILKPGLAITIRMFKAGEIAVDGRGVYTPDAILGKK